MTPQETTILLGFIQGVDNRFVPDQKTVSAWMNVLPPDLELQNAIRYAREHYTESDKSIMPAHIVGLHRLALRAERETRTTNVVEPEHDCMGGYVLVEEERDGRTITAAAKCQICATSPRP